MMNRMTIQTQKSPATMLRRTMSYGINACIQQICSASLHPYHVSTSRTISAPCLNSWATSTASLLPPQSLWNLASAASSLLSAEMRFALVFLAGFRLLTKARTFFSEASLSSSGFISRNSSARNSIVVIILTYLVSGGKDKQNIRINKKKQ